MVRPYDFLYGLASPCLVDIEGEQVVELVVVRGYPVKKFSDSFFLCHDSGFVPVLQYMVTGQGHNRFLPTDGILAASLR